MDIDFGTIYYKTSMGDPWKIDVAGYMYWACRTGRNHTQALQGPIPRFKNVLKEGVSGRRSHQTLMTRCVAV